MKAPKPPSSTTPLTDFNQNQFNYSWTSWIGKLFVFLRAVVRINSTSTTATAGSQTLPANPLGFIVTELEDGTVVKIPYYNT